MGATPLQHPCYIGTTYWLYWTSTGDKDTPNCLWNETFDEDVGAAAEEDAEAEVVGERFVRRSAEVGVEFRAEDVAWGEGVTPLGTDVGGEDAGEVVTRLGREGGEEWRAVEGAEVMRPNGSGEKAHLTEEITTQSKPSAQAFIERP